jgi:putative lipoprotein
MRLLIKIYPASLSITWRAKWVNSAKRYEGARRGPKQHKEAVAHKPGYHRLDVHECSKARFSAGIALVLFLCLAARPCRASDRDDADPWWGKDKALHFSASALIAVDGYAAASLVSKREAVRAGAGSLLAFAAGAAKEIYDRSAGGDPSLRDLTWDVVGAATGTALSWLVDRFFFDRME